MYRPSRSSATATAPPISSERYNGVVTTNGAKLRARRTTMGLTQSAAAVLASISQSNWSAHESGTRPLTDAMLARLSDAIAFRPSIAATVHRDRIRDICAAHGATAPRLFGSAAKGTDTVESDLDIMVAAAAGTTMFDLIALEEELEALCGVPVDVVTDGAVRGGGPAWSNLDAVAV
jgi:predicted nucleotidyltransferase